MEISSNKLSTEKIRGRNCQKSICFGNGHFFLSGVMAHILEKLEGEAVDCIRIRRFVNGFVRNIAKVHFLKLKM